MKRTPVASRSPPVVCRAALPRTANALALRTVTRTVPAFVTRSPVRAETSAWTPGRGPKRPTAATRAGTGVTTCSLGVGPEPSGVVVAGVQAGVGLGAGPGAGPGVGSGTGSGIGVGVGSGVGEPSAPMSRGLKPVSIVNPMGRAIAPTARA